MTKNTATLDVPESALAIIRLAPDVAAIGKSRNSHGATVAIEPTDLAGVKA